VDNLRLLVTEQNEELAKLKENTELAINNRNETISEVSKQ
jgi:hypothetical protein